MRWPWTSAARLDDLHEQIAWLREQNAALTDQIVRIQRKEAGLPEQAKPPRPPAEPMPPLLMKYIDGIGNPSLRASMRDECDRQRRAGKSWEEILAYVLAPGEEEIP